MPVVISNAVVVPDTPTRPQKCIKAVAVKQQKIIMQWPRCRGNV